MEAIAALGLASNIIQIVDFSSRIIARGREIQNSADGSLADHAVLSHAASRLEELYGSLNASDKTRGGGKRAITVADQQLLELKIESRKVVQELQAALNKAKSSKTNSRWQSVRHALVTVRSDKEISRLAARLEGIRQQVDSAVLLSIQYDP